MNKYYNNVKKGCDLSTLILKKYNFIITDMNQSPYSNSVYVELNNSYIIKVSDHYLNSWNDTPKGEVFEHICETGNFMFNEINIKLIKDEIDSYNTLNIGNDWNSLQIYEGHYTNDSKLILLTDCSNTFEQKLKEIGFDDFFGFRDFRNISFKSNKKKYTVCISNTTIERYKEFNNIN